MIKVNKAVIGMIFSFLLLSCKEDDYYFNLNESPDVYIVNNYEYLKSVQLHYKIGQEPINIFLKINDDQSKHDIVLTENNANSEFNILNDSTISIKPLLSGEYIYDIEIIDPYMIKDEVSVYINSFINLPPIARINVQEDEFFLKLDASNSYDSDSTYGGSIIKYEFLVNGTLVYSGNKNTKIINKTTNVSTYNIGLRVQDNNGEWANETIIYTL